MRRFLFTLAVIFPLTLSVSQSEVLEYELPNLTGGSHETTKVDSFLYVGPAADVNNVSVKFSGTIYDLGLVACAVPPGVDPYYVWWLDLNGALWKKGAVGEGIWKNWYILIYLGAFDHTRGCDGGFGTIEDGDVVAMELDFSMNDDWQWPSPMGWCSLVTEAYGEMHGVTVMLDVTYKVPVKPSTWGRIKGLYQ